MEAVFSRFDSFDFESDRRFVDGLKTVRDRDRDKELDMKLFFYNRFVEPIDRTSYKQWSSASPHVTQTDCSDEATPSGSDSDISNNQTAETSAETEATQQLSFAEVMRLVQEGKEVPGAKKLDVKPTNQNPTPSAMERRLKPWETPK
ncbi:uncharacterized protein LOC104933329 [Larimichthys crocea]|uniref:Uncharacterized protein n=1 Tax=Larimichthys crocea TaxID=215358 RepID=A0ACD3RBK8_LARCR|nr:uncharacterized protein C6orf226 homolog [Larimichthys crocea]TMS16765.1 Uncharacterized protein E3U43_014058 [Larimichthys crocea]